MTRLQKPAIRHRPLMIALTLIAIILLAGPVLFGLFMAPAFRADRGPLRDVRKATEITGLHFPPGTQVIGSEYLRQLGKVQLIGKFRLPPDQVREFVSQPALWPAQPGQGEVLWLASAELAKRGWHLDTARKVLSGGSRDDGQSSQQVSVSYSIDMDNPQAPLLYLYAHD